MIPQLFNRQEGGGKSVGDVFYYTLGAKTKLSNCQNTGILNHQFRLEKRNEVLICAEKHIKLFIVCLDTLWALTDM